MFVGYACDIKDAVNAFACIVETRYDVMSIFKVGLKASWSRQITEGNRALHIQKQFLRFIS